jgi:hypothetical protein
MLGVIQFVIIDWFLSDAVKIMLGDVMIEGANHITVMRIYSLGLYPFCPTSYRPLTLPFRVLAALVTANLPS